MTIGTSGTTFDNYREEKMEEKGEGEQTRAGSKDLLAAQTGAMGRAASEVQ
jgi:hypothetical protein